MNTAPTSHPSWCDRNPRTCWCSDAGTVDETTWHGRALPTLVLREMTIHDRVVHIVEPTWSEITDESDDEMASGLAQLQVDAATAREWLEEVTGQH